MRQLLPHQELALKYATSRSGVAFFMDMRLGKSLTTIRWVQEQGYAKVLLLAPMTPLIDWQDELAREGEDFVLLEGSKKKNDELLGSADWTLSTYQSAKNIRADQYAWDCVILDESTTIKNPQAGITKWALRKLRPASGAWAVLSGLPNPQEPLELWTQMAFVNNGRWMGFGNYWTFRKAKAFQVMFDWTVRPKSMAEIKEAMHRDAFVMTRKDAGLPYNKNYKVIHGNLHPDVAALREHIASEWEIPGGPRTKYAPVVASWIQQLEGGFVPGKILPSWKYGYLEDLVLHGDLRDEPVVVWCAFNKEVRRVARLLNGVTLYGDDNREARKRKINLFRSGQTRVLVAQIACGKFGLDLSTSDVEIYFSCNYSYEGRRQSEERIQHPTKKSDLLVMDLVTHGGADEAVMESLRAKKSSATYFLSRLSKRFANLTSGGSRLIRGSTSASRSGSAPRSTTA